ncbi:MAG TPA: pitrilysin family protein [Syntrophorhabdaceae bacterium]|nr:pitrilysin family protein [Syntrophorhabdaceae bacterium]
MNINFFDNGLETILERRRNTGVVAAQVWVKVGSKYEDQKIAGITHFIEHLIFKGTKKLKGNAFAARIESLGGAVNAFTSYDNTVYHITVPAKAFEDGVGLLIESVMNPAFPQEEIEKERNVVLEEIKMGEDDPQRKLFNELFSVSYKGHPYGRPIIGFTGTVEGITRPTILRYYKKHYTPDNMTVVVVGDFNEESARAIIGRTLGRTERRASHGFSLTETMIAQEGARVSVIEKDVRERYLALSYRIPSISHEDTAAIEVLGTILGDGESSRLNKSLKREKGILTNTATYIFSPRESGLLVIYATFKDGEYDPIVREIDNELEKIKTGHVTDWELEKAKNMLRASYVYSEETVQGKARQIGNFQTVTGDAHFLDKFLNRIDRVSQADVKKVFENYLLQKNRSIVLLKPKQEGNPHALELRNGLKCVVNRNEAAPSFSFRIGFVGGLKEEPPGKNGIFNLLSRMLLKDTAKKDASAIAAEIDFLAGDISPYNGRNLFGLSGKFLSKDADKVMLLVKEILTETVLRQEELTKVKEEALSEIRQRDDDPVAYTFTRFNEAFYKGHPYSKDPMGAENDVEGVTIEELNIFYKRFVTPSHAVMAVSGDLDKKELFRFVEEYFTDWKGETNTIVELRHSASAQRAALQRQIMQTHVVLGFPGPGLIDEDRYAVEVLDATLSGMGGRIHRVLREENPYAYAVTFFNQQAYEVSAMGIYIGTDPDHVKDVERLSEEEIGNIIRNGFSDKEIEDGKSYLIGNHYIRMQSNGAMATNMCFDTMYGMKPGFFKGYPSRIEKVTKDDVNRVARTYLTRDKLVEVTVGKK